MTKAVHPLVYRTRRAVDRYGVRGAARRVLARAVLAESHVWYGLDVTGPRQKPAFAPGVAVRRAGEDDLELLEQLPTLSPVEGSERIRAGNDLWLVLEDDRPLFSCWIFRRQTPMIAAPGGQLRLPEGTVCVEDSVTAASARGHGIAPAAWASIADSLAEEGQRLMITKVAVENGPSRRAVEKAGFVAIALMHFRRLGPWARTSVEVLDEDRGGFLVGGLGAAELDRGAHRTRGA